MKFKVKTEDLLSKLTKIGGVASTKTTLPITESILFEIENGILALHVNNCSVYARTILPVVSEDTFAFCIEHRVLDSTLRLLKDPEIEFELTEGTVTIRSGRRKLYSIGSFDPKDFPKMETVITRPPIQIVVPTIEFIKALHNANHFPDPKDIRPQFSGACLRLGGETLNVIGIGSSGSLMTIQYCTYLAQTDWQDASIPKSSAKLMTEMMFGVTTWIGRFDDNKLHIKSGEIDMVVTLLEVKFPSISQFIERPVSSSCVIDKNEIISSLKRVIGYSDKTLNACQLTFADSEITLTSEYIEVNKKASESIDVINSGVSLTTGFNAAQLLDMVLQVDSEKLIFYLSSFKELCIIRPEDQVNDKSIYFIMPLMVNGNK